MSNGTMALFDEVSFVCVLVFHALFKTMITKMLGNCMLLPKYFAFALVCFDCWL